MKLIMGLFILVSCGKDDGEINRCQSAEEAQMRCQLDYMDKYQPYTIPEWVTKRCVQAYPKNGCYLEIDRHYF